MVVIIALIIAPATSDTPITSILFVGDSLTLGLSAVDQGHSYESLLLDRLRQERRVDWAESVIEHPYGLTDNAELKAAAYLGAHPRTIIVEVGTHEVHAPPVQQAQFQQRYARLLDHLAAAHATIIVGTIPWLGYQPSAVDYGEAVYLNGIIRHEAAMRDLVVVDLWKPTVGVQAILSTPEESTFMPPFQGDFFHPGNYGHQLLAEAFWPALDRVEKHESRNRSALAVSALLPVSLLAQETEEEAE